MKEFNDLCKDFEAMEPLQYGAYLLVKSTELIPQLGTVEIDGIDGVTIYYYFVLCALSADGELNEEEFYLVAPLFKGLFGPSITFEDAKVIFDNYQKNSDKNSIYATRMIKVLHKLPENMKDDLIIISMMVCAVDGKISIAEKKWIMQLMQDK